MWKTLKNIIKPKESVQSSIAFGTEIIEEEIIIVHKFNEYFLDSIKEIIESIETPDNAVIQNETQFENIRVWDTFIPMNYESLKKIVQSLPNKAGTEEGISVALLKNSFHIVGSVLLDVVNYSLKTGIFPL